MKKKLFLVAANTPNSDYAVSVSTKQSASISTPAQACTVDNLLLVGGSSMGILGLFSLGLQINLQILNNALALQIPDLDTVLSGSTKPVPVRAKA